MLKKMMVLTACALFALCAGTTFAEDIAKAPEAKEMTISEEVVYEGTPGMVVNDCSVACDPCCVPCRPLLGRLFCRRAYCVPCAPAPICAPRCAPRYNPCPPVACPPPVCPRPYYGCFAPRFYCAPAYCAPVVYAPVFVRPYYYGCYW